MSHYTNTFKLLIVNIFIVSLLIVSYFYGYISSFFTDDITHISYILAFLMSINVILTIYNTFFQEKNKYYQLQPETKISRYLEYAVGQLTYIGLLGTVIGMGHMFKSIQYLKDVDQVLKIVSEGGLTLFNTTIVAIFSYLWTRFNLYIVTGK